MTPPPATAPGIARVTARDRPGLGWLRLDGQAFPVALGRAGITAHKIEGDGATPAGLLPLRRVLYRADRRAAPSCTVPTGLIGPQDGWCDDPDDAAYNRLVTLPYPARHEELWRSDTLYNLVGVLGWNDQPPMRGAGSAIFLHVATADLAPTAGCVALPEPQLAALLAAGLRGLWVVGGDQAIDS